MGFKNLCYIVVVNFFIGLISSCSASKPAVENYTKPSNNFSKKNELAITETKNFSDSIAALPVQHSIVVGSVSIPTHWVLTPNFNLRKPNFIILHYTAQDSCEQTLKFFADTARQVSAHYLVCKDGSITQLLNDYLRAWHAGISFWGGNTDINSSSIGIEIDNNGIDSFTNHQVDALFYLLKSLKTKYNIPTKNFLAHADVAPTRKIDPGTKFPWKQLADSGYGIWYADTTALQVPADFDAKLALRIIGYDVSNMAAARQAFRIRYLGKISTDAFTIPEQKVLYAIMRQYL